jgi:hypothetical protein
MKAVKNDLYYGRHLEISNPSFPSHTEYRS